MSIVYLALWAMFTFLFLSGNVGRAFRKKEFYAKDLEKAIAEAKKFFYEEDKDVSKEMKKVFIALIFLAISLIVVLVDLIGLLVGTSALASTPHITMFTFFAVSTVALDCIHVVNTYRAGRYVNEEDWDKVRGCNLTRAHAIISALLAAPLLGYIIIAIATLI